jgi:hypothetical protein
MSNRTLVHETANAPGTNVTFNLAGPVSGRRSFAMAFVTGAPAFYVITDGVQSEWGLGTFTAGAPNQLSRTTVYGNSINTTARLNFTGVVDVYNALPAEEMVTISDGPLAGFRNLIINGNPIINQRAYVSGAAVGAANTYTLDRWRVVTSGQSVSWADSAGIRTVTAPAGGMEQVIEGASNLGGVHTISWSGSATATVGGAAVANGGQVTLTGGANVTVRMIGGTWSQLQLEPGPKKTPFERRPMAVEQALCDRYFIRQSMLAAAYNPSAMFGSLLALPFRARMRTTPTVAVSSTSSNSNTNAFSVGQIDDTAGYAVITNATAGNCSVQAIIFIDAEL